MATDSVVHQLAIRVSNRLRDERLMLVTAESCTGGMVATAITDISGSSGWFERGFVTYSNQAKSEMIGVPADLIEKHGAVSEPVARAMAEGALRNSRAQVSLSITGVAGPGGGSERSRSGLCRSAGATACILLWKRWCSRATAKRSARKPPLMRCEGCWRCSTSASGKALPMPTPELAKDDLIRRFDLQPHPEGGFFRETYRSMATVNREGSGETRSASTAIYYLLCDGAHSAWHRIKSDEVWHFYAGEPLLVHVLDEAGQADHASAGQSADPSGDRVSGGSVGRTVVCGRVRRPGDVRAGGLHGGAGI